jgi:hypothetical protein
MKTLLSFTKNIKMITVLAVVVFSNIHCSKLLDATDGKSSGSLVREELSKVYVYNLANKKETFFEAVPYSEGGVSVSNNGTIAQMQERERNPEGVYVLITKLNGEKIQDFTHEEPYSFVKSGIRISPDGSKVAFALHVQLDGGGSTDRLIVYNLKTLRYTFWNNLSFPGWTADNRLLAVGVSGKQLFRSNVAVDYMDTIGPNNLDRVNYVDGASTTDYVLYSNNAGVPQSFAMNIATGQSKLLFSDGVGQFFPVAGAGSVFYLHSCCKADFVSPRVLHKVPEKLTSTTPTPMNKYQLTGSSGKTLKATERYGYTPASL